MPAARRIPWRWLITLTLAIAIAKLAIGFTPYGISRSNRRVAVYEHMRFYGFPQFVRITINSPQEAPLYVEMPDKKRYLLNSLPQSEVAKFFDRADSEARSLYYRGTNTISYRGGKVSTAGFWFADGMRFSSNEDGPYLSMPFDDEELIRVFGKPITWERPGRLGPAF